SVSATLSRFTHSPPTSTLFFCFSFLFFFYCYADHRDLHSFPTRRSSDLRFRFRAPPEATAITPQQRRAAFGSRSASRLCGWFRRSEEHTSELQSRENLVCRLLLEKKKK